MGRFALTAAFAGLALGGVAAADELAIEPGEWKTDVDISISLLANGQAVPLPPQNQTQTECLSAEDAVLSPADLAEDGCTVSDVKSTSTSLSFAMACAQNGVTLTGSMSVEKNADGTETTGSFSMEGEQPGVGKISLSGTLAGSRVGVCAP